MGTEKTLRNKHRKEKRTVGTIISSKKAIANFFVFSGAKVDKRKELLFDSWTIEREILYSRKYPNNCIFF